MEASVEYPWATPVDQMHGAAKIDRFQTVPQGSAEFSVGASLFDIAMLMPRIAKA